MKCKTYLLMAGVLALGIAGITKIEEETPKIEANKRLSNLEKIIERRRAISLKKQEETSSTIDFPNDPYLSYLEEKSPFSRIFYETYKQERRTSPEKGSNNFERSRTPYIQDIFPQKITDNVQRFSFLLREDFPDFADEVFLEFLGKKKKLTFDKNFGPGSSISFYFYNEGMKMPFDKKLPFNLEFFKKGEKFGGTYNLKQPYFEPEVL
jgi:hypothetical protein